MIAKLQKMNHQAQHISNKVSYEVKRSSFIYVSAEIDKAIPLMSEDDLRDFHVEVRDIDRYEFG